MGIRNPNSTDMKSAIYCLESGIQGVNSRIQGRFPFNSKFRKFWLVHQMERTYSFWSDRNVRNQLWRWSTLTGLVILIGRTEMSLSVWQNCCPKYRSFVSCLQEQWPSPRWLESGLCNRNVSFHWARGSSESSNRNCSLVYPRLSWITLPGWNIMKYDIWLHISYGHIYHTLGPNIQACSRVTI